jgi:hypothetical protein
LQVGKGGLPPLLRYAQANHSFFNYFLHDLSFKHLLMDASIRTDKSLSDWIEFLSAQPWPTSVEEEEQAVPNLLTIN